MRHRRTGRKLGVVTKHRRAMLRNLATTFFKYGSMKTTDSRAKEVRRVVEKLITIAKKGTLQHRRQAASYLKDKDVLKKLFSEVVEKYKERPGGYTRIVKLGFRKGDGAPISLIELIQDEYKSKPKKRRFSTKAKDEIKKKDAVSEKSNKKESAEELGLVEDRVKVSDVKSNIVEEYTTSSDVKANEKEEVVDKSPENLKDDAINNKTDSELQKQNDN